MTGCLSRGGVAEGSEKVDEGGGRVVAGRVAVRRGCRNGSLNFSNN